jgi:hypothetical protein
MDIRRQMERGSGWRRCGVAYDAARVVPSWDLVKDRHRPRQKVLSAREKGLLLDPVGRRALPDSLCVSQPLREDHL